VKGQLYGYLVAWERSHHDSGWEWIAFTNSLYFARQAKKDWEKLGHDPDCSACVREGKAYIFGWPYDPREDLER
jgi:hypothetical protein